MPVDVISFVSPKMPNPWPEAMKMWLTAVDYELITCGITQKLMKFHYILGALTIIKLTELSDVT